MRYRVCWHSGSCTVARGRWFQGSEALQDVRDIVEDSPAGTWIEDENGNRVDAIATTAI